jgi:hypothetical protein
MKLPLKVRRGATLIEAVIVVLVLAIAVPPMVVGVSDSVNRRSDAIQLIRASTLASTVMNQIKSDSITTDIGTDIATYLNRPATGLRARLDRVTSIMTSAGLSYDVAVSERLNLSLVPSGNPTRDLFRTVTVTVRFTDSKGSLQQIPFDTVVSIP